MSIWRFWFRIRVPGFWRAVALLSAGDVVVNRLHEPGPITVQCVSTASGAAAPACPFMNRWHSLEPPAGGGVL